jgi:ubiquinone/menaquinone biosynthesis C-methylase UbiE
MESIKTIIYRDKAVASHSENAAVFADRYELMEKDPYANAFIYGRKKLFEFLFPFLSEKLEPGSKILDVGSGTGYLANALIRRGYQTIGIEPAAGMREQSLRKYPRIEAHAGTAGELPFAGETFDAVIAVEVFRYLAHDDIIAGYRECLRVLKPGGYLIITLVNRYSLDGFVILYHLRLFLEKLAGRPMVNYCDFVTPAGIKRLFKDEFDLDIETKAMLFSPLRLIYKINAGWGRRSALALEKLDGYLAGKKWWQPFAGHLAAVVRKK